MPYFLRTLISYPVALNTYVHEFAMLDVDGDGDQDVVLARFGPPAEFAGIPIQVLLNNGSGGFTDGTSTIFPSGAPVTFHPRGIAIADYNGDGRPDLFIADHGWDDIPYPGAQNTLLLSSGAHGFVDGTDRLPQLSDYSHSTTAGDIDGDGDIDILVMNTNGG
ncbi:MAG TPA: VCBS repeat-containing protein, partial [Sphingomicrobium sp.]|nr:VCBS repeat-containing protein [Sphingomicrobium sp.]